MKVFSRLLLFVIISNVLFQVVHGACGAGLVYASDPPKKTAPRAVKKRRAPLKKEIETNSLPTSRGQDATFEDTKGMGVGGKPVDAVLILDSSRSMKRNDPDRLRDQGARLFLQFLEPDDRFSIIEFGEMASVLSPLQYIRSTDQKEIKRIVDGIENEGNFTDFLFPIEEALDILENAKRAGAEKVIILLSDGHMDPDPTKGDKGVRTDTLLKEMIPSLHKKNIKLYSLALSEEADKVILKNMSQATGGLSWYAKEVNEIHRIFSDLFLSIKKPQVLELSKDGFEIDGSTQEATFFVSRASKDETVLVVDPVGKEYLNKDFPSSWKWFKGELFDIITVPSPLPGTWFVTGGKEASGFAKLLSNLKLEYSWPSSSFDVGDTVILKTRLTESGELLDSPELKDLIYYNYKIINVSTGSVYIQGKLLESETGVFQSSIQLNDEGEFKLFLTVTSPTFTRQVHVPFSVTRGIVSLVHIPGSEFSETKDSYEVVLHHSTDKMKNVTVGLFSYVKGNIEERYVVPLKDYKIKERTYLVPLQRLKPGKNIVTGVITAIGEDRQKITAKSELMEIFVSEDANLYEKAQEEETLELENIDFSGDSAEPKEEFETYLVFGLLGLFISFITSFAFGRYFIQQSSKDGGIVVSPRNSYDPPASLIEQVEKIKSGASEAKRPVSEFERELFSILPDYDEVVKLHTSEDSEHSSSDENEKEVPGEFDEEGDEVLKSEEESENETDNEPENDESDALNKEQA
jgi:Mg-chelatase subunit ChlD